MVPGAPCFTSIQSIPGWQYGDYLPYKFSGQAQENPQTLQHADLWILVLVLMPTASSGGCGLFF
jgi:hypothetical protein